MQFTPQLAAGTFQKRYKRFFVDITLSDANSEPQVAHVANTGSLKSTAEPGADCLVQPSSNPGRKLKWSLMALRPKTARSWIGVNTALPNQLVKEAFTHRVLWPEKSEWTLRSEVKINAESRLDFCLELGEQRHYVEVKNVTLGTLKGDGLHAQFPDAATERGVRHLRELAKLVRDGFEAELLFVVQREDCVVFSPAEEIDPIYAEELRRVIKAGVRVRAVVCSVSEKEISITRNELPVLT